MRHILVERRAARPGQPPQERPRVRARATRGPQQRAAYKSPLVAYNDRKAQSPRLSVYVWQSNLTADRDGGGPKAATESPSGSLAAAAASRKRDRQGPPPPRSPSDATASAAVTSPATAAAAAATAAAATAPPAAAATSASDLNRSLMMALAEQFRAESLPWILDLVAPLLEGPPPPLTGTEPPERLADRDSRFLTVNGIRIHYKMTLPGEREGPEAVAVAAKHSRTRAPPPPATGMSPAAASLLSSSPSSSSATRSPSALWSWPLVVSRLDNSSPSSLSSAAAAAAAAGSSSSSSRPSAAPTTPPPYTANRSPSSIPKSDAAPTLLLIHGLNGSTFNWRLLMDDLAAYVSPNTGGCRVVAYDRPPYGLSQRPLTWHREEDNPYTLEGGARLAAGLLDALLGPPGPPPPSPLPPTAGAAAVGRKEELSPWGPATIVGSGGSRSSGGSSSSSSSSRYCGGRAAVLVGHSAGAAVAVETALRYPERVCGLVLIAPAISTDPRGFLARADLGQLLRFAWTRALLSADGPGLNFIRRLVMKRKAEVEAGRLGVYLDEREVPQEVIDGYLRPLRAQDWDMGTLMVYRSMQVSGTPPALEQIRVPVLVLQGRQDRTVPLEAAQAVAAALRRRRGPGAVTEMVVLEDCAHVPMDERPLEVLATVADFVNRHCCGPRDRPQQLQ